MKTIQINRPKSETIEAPTGQVEPVRKIKVGQLPDGRVESAKTSVQKRVRLTILKLKKLVVGLARQFYPKKTARSTTGSDVVVDDIKLRAVAGTQPNILHAYRKAHLAALGKGAFGVVTMDHDSDRLVVTIDAEFLFRVLTDSGVHMVAEIWGQCFPDER